MLLLWEGEGSGWIFPQMKYSEKIDFFFWKVLRAIVHFQALIRGVRCRARRQTRRPCDHSSVVFPCNVTPESATTTANTPHFRSSRQPTSLSSAACSVGEDSVSIPTSLDYLSFLPPMERGLRRLPHSSSSSSPASSLSSSSPSWGTVVSPVLPAAGFDNNREWTVQECMEAFTNEGSTQLQRFHAANTLSRAVCSQKHL